MELSKDVFYRQYGDSVYLRHVGLRRDLLLNASAYRALELLKAAGSGSREELLKALVTGGAGSEKGCARFLDSLLAEGVITGGEAEKDDLSIRNRMLELCDKEDRLFSASLELTYRCNERCVHCYVDDAPDAGRELTLAEYEKLIDDLGDMGCMYLHVTGGEVLLKRELLPILRRAVSRGLAVDIYTNGYAMTDELFDELKELHLNSLSYSLYGGTPAVHDAVTKVPGSFERTLRAVMMTKCAGIDTFIKTVVMRENVADFENLLKLCRRLDIPLNASYEIMDTHNGVSAEKHRLEKVEDYLSAMRLQHKYDPQPTSGRRDPDGPVCNAGRGGLAVDPYGNVKYCLSLPVNLGNIRERPVREIWENRSADWLKKLTFRDVCGSCESCQYMDSCGVCLAATGAAPGKIPVLPDYPCKLAEASHRTALGE